MKESKNTEETAEAVKTALKSNQESREVLGSYMCKKSRELLESYMRLYKLPTVDQAILKIFKEVKSVQIKDDLKTCEGVEEYTPSEVELKLIMSKANQCMDILKEMHYERIAFALVYLIDSFETHYKIRLNPIKENQIKKNQNGKN